MRRTLVALLLCCSLTAGAWWVATHPTGLVTRALIFAAVVPVAAIVVAVVQLGFHRAEDWWRARISAWWRGRVGQ